MTKSIKETLGTLVRNAIENKSHEQKREFKDSVERDIYHYVANSENWISICDEMAEWNDVYRFHNITNELQLTFMPVGLIMRYTPELKKGV